MTALCGWLPTAPPLKLYRILYLPAAQAPDDSIRVMISVDAMAARALLTASQNLLFFMLPSRHIAWRVCGDDLRFGFSGRRRALEDCTARAGGKPVSSELS